MWHSFQDFLSLKSSRPCLLGELPHVLCPLTELRYEFHHFVHRLSRNWAKYTAQIGSSNRYRMHSIAALHSRIYHALLFLLMVPSLSTEKETACTTGLFSTPVRKFDPLRSASSRTAECIAGEQPLNSPAIQPDSVDAPNFSRSFRIVPVSPSANGALKNYAACQARDCKGVDSTAPGSV